jgi:hypothetical protein
MSRYLIRHGEGVFGDAHGQRLGPFVSGRLDAPRDVRTHEVVNGLQRPDVDGTPRQCRVDSRAQAVCVQDVVVALSYIATKPPHDL